jgi:Amt family ammonium transporter
MNLAKPFWAGLLPALALYGVFLCTAFVSAQEAAPETKKEEPAAAATEAPTAEEPKAEEKKEEPAAATADTPAAEEKKEEAAPPAMPPSGLETQYAVDNIVLFICAVLVIFMQAGFSLVEVGLNSSKNAVNIMFKNYMDFVIGALLFFIVGFGIMFPSKNAAKTVLIPEVLEFANFGIYEATAEATTPGPGNTNPMLPQAFFLFQVAFAATAATIVSGSVAGRIKFASYMVYTAVITGLIYPISGMWMWGEGWLWDMGFRDFAGSVVVHTVGGMAGLAGAIALGPRLGRFIDGKPMAMPGHNIPFATLGVFILLIGWYGFNPGSQLAFAGKANTDAMMIVAVNTTLAACTGAFAAMIFSWAVFKKPDLTFALNGGLAGLVAITANCNGVTHVESLIIGAVGGVLVCMGCMLLDKLQIDDPVGAFPVHGLCGMWGGIATGIFAAPDSFGAAGTSVTLSTQIIGTLAIGGWALGASLVLFYGLKAIGLLRVHAEEEIAGLDISEHGMYAYPQQVVALDSVNSSFGTSQMKLTSHGSMATKPAESH